MVTRPLTDHDLELTTRAVRFPKRVVALDEARVLYEDALPMSDVRVAPTGATCCLRRSPGRAEVVSWGGTPGGNPTSWTAAANVPLLASMRFDGEELLARTESALLRILPDRIETVYETKGRIGEASVSTDGGDLLWTERKPARLCTMRLREERRVREAVLPSDCAGIQAAWLPGGDIIACLLSADAGVETGMALIHCAADLRSHRPLIATRSWVLQPMTAASPDSFVVQGTRRDTAGSSSRDRQSAVWLLSLQPLTLSCLARGRIAGGTVASVGGVCLFADAWQQTALSSTLVAVSASVVRVTLVPEFLREFELSEERLLFCTRGERFAIRALSIRGLMAPNHNTTTDHRES
jgi:hypothetical protein